MMLRSPVVLEPLDIAEIDDIPFDYSAHMREGETIANVAITAAVEQGDADYGAQDMVSGAYTIGRIEDGEFVAAADGRVVLQRIDATARVPGNVYCLRGVATFSSGRQLTAAAHVAVKRL